MRLFLSLFLSCWLMACQDAVLPEPQAENPAGKAATLYKISRGKHHATRQYQALEAASLSFQAMFDSSAIYTTTDPGNQADINKLLGISDCDTHHHTNSARFGWRWYEGELQILAYTYANGQRNFQLLGSVSLGAYHSYSLSFEEDTYVFQLDGGEPVILPRACSGTAKGYKLYPYFGGDEPAPQDVSLWVVEE
ncbi:MAG: hypothetical protein KY428_04480 [Bacteroidetes bacterium]|nr:hypothetical protein [Bacteroidota bacterium]